MNLVIDGNAFLNVAISIVKNILAQDKRVGEKYYVSDLLDETQFSLKQVSKDTFRQFSVNYLGSIFAPFKENISSVFFVFDSKSWRHQYIKEHFSEHGEGDFLYKGQRKYDDKMYLFFEYFQNEILHQIAEEYGIVVTRVHGAEGDDLIAYICENLKEDICIWTVDKDLTQLVEDRERRIIVIMPKQMTKYKKLYTSIDSSNAPTKVVAPSTDIFNFDLESINNSGVSNVINDLLQKDYKQFEVDPTNDILVKFLSGDASDKIPRVHPKMTAAKVAKVIETVRNLFYHDDIISLIDSGDQAFIDKLNEVTCESLRLKDPGECQTIQNNLHRNTILIRLNTAMFPKEILTAIKENIDLSSRRRFNYYKFKKNYKN